MNRLVVTVKSIRISMYSTKQILSCYLFPIFRTTLFVFFAFPSLVCLGLTNRNLHARCVHSYKTVEREGIEPQEETTAAILPPLQFSRVFPRCPSLLEIPFYLLLHQGLCTHTTTVKSWERYVSISSPTLTPTRANVHVGENQKVCCLAQSRTVFSSAKNLRNTVIPQGNTTFGTAREFMANVTQVWQSLNAQSRKSLLTTLQKYNKVLYYANFWREKFTSYHFLPKGRGMT